MWILLMLALTRSQEYIQLFQPTVPIQRINGMPQPNSIFQAQLVNQATQQAYMPQAMGAGRQQQPIGGPSFVLPQAVPGSGQQYVIPPSSTQQHTVVQLPNGQQMYVPVQGINRQPTIPVGQAPPFVMPTHVACPSPEGALKECQVDGVCRAWLQLMRQECTQNPTAQCVARVVKKVPSDGSGGAYITNPHVAHMVGCILHNSFGTARQPQMPTLSTHAIPSTTGSAAGASRGVYAESHSGALKEALDRIRARVDKRLDKRIDGYGRYRHAQVRDTGPAEPDELNMPAETARPALARPSSHGSSHAVALPDRRDHRRDDGHDPHEEPQAYYDGFNGLMDDDIYDLIDSLKAAREAQDEMDSHRRQHHEQHDRQHTGRHHSKHHGHHHHGHEDEEHPHETFDEHGHKHVHHHHHHHGGHKHKDHHEDPDLEEVDEDLRTNHVHHHHHHHHHGSHSHGNPPSGEVSATVHDALQQFDEVVQNDLVRKHKGFLMFMALLPVMFAAYYLFSPDLHAGLPDVIAPKVLENG